MPKIIKYIFSAIGLSLLVGCFFLYKSTHDFIKRSVQTSGEVTDYKIETDSDGSETYYPIVQFKTSQGELIEFTSRYGGKPPAFSTGEVVSVLYDPTAPEKARINTFFSLWLGAMIVGGLGIIFTLVGLGMIVSRQW